MKKLFITGVTRGIGRAMVFKLHQRFEIYGVYKSSESYKEEEEEAQEILPYVKKLYPADLVDKSSIDEIIKKVSSEVFFGVINNAAEILNWKDKGASQIDFETWERTIGVNLTAPMMFSTGLKIEYGGRVINISSTDADFSGLSNTPYSVSKAGLNNLTKSLASIFSPKSIRVNAISPGWVNTGMSYEALDKYTKYKTPLGRNAEPEEIVNVIDFLLSEKSSFINGAIIKVDGGYSSVDYVFKKEDNIL